MKKIAVAVLTFLVTSVALAQSNDLANYFKVTENGTQKIPWYTYNKGALSVDARYNFDWPNTTSIFLGRNVTQGQTTLTYELGGIVGGGHGGISPELLTYTEHGKVSIFSLYQVAFSVKNDPYFVFHYGDLLYSLSPRVKAGLDEQIYYERGMAGPDIDVGPVVKVTIKPAYVKAWWSVNPTGRLQKTFFAVGTNF